MTNAGQILARYFYYTAKQTSKNMKKNLLLLLMPLIILVILFWTNAFYSLIPAGDAHGGDATVKTGSGVSAEPEIVLASYKYVKPSTDNPPETSREIISYALSLIGSPYVYAGTTPNGFDCSGFITHVFEKSGIDLPHSSAMQADEGIQVAKHEARNGDLVIFTGTDPGIRKPGHVGIVISAPGDTIEFVHSSSNGGVKISKVEGTRYDLRFLEVRRVL